MPCTNTPGIPAFAEDPIQSVLETSESLTLVVQKRDLSREMQIMQIDIAVDADAHRVRKLGLVLTNRDGRYLEVHEIKEDSIIAECNDSVEGWISVGDKILGLNSVPGEDHTEIIDFLKDNSDFQFVLGRPIEVLEELLPPRKHFVRENELIEV